MTREPHAMVRNASLQGTTMIRSATPADVPAIAQLIRGLAEYERLAGEVVLTEENLHEHLFGQRKYAEVLLAEEAGVVVAFALFFHNYSTFLGQPGIYLEDLFVEPEHRGKGLGKGLFVAVAQLAIERSCGRMEWSVLNWNTPSIDFYKSMGAESKDAWSVYRLTGESLRNLAAGT